MTTTLTTAKQIAYNKDTKDFDATFDGQYIGSFPTYGAAENALNDHVLLLCEQGLIDAPLAALAEQALAAANPVSDPDDGPPPPWEGTCDRRHCGKPIDIVALTGPNPEDHTYRCCAEHFYAAIYYGDDSVIVWRRTPAPAA